MADSAAVSVQVGTALQKSFNTAIGKGIEQVVWLSRDMADLDDETDLLLHTFRKLRMELGQSIAVLKTTFKTPGGSNSKDEGRGIPGWAGALVASLSVSASFNRKKVAIPKGKKGKRKPPGFVLDSFSFGFGMKGAPKSAKPVFPPQFGKVVKAFSGAVRQFGKIVAAFRKSVRNTGQSRQKKSGKRKAGRPSRRSGSGKKGRGARKSPGPKPGNALAGKRKASGRKGRAGKPGNALGRPRMPRWGCRPPSTS